MTFHPRSSWATRAPSFGDLHLPVRRVFAHHTAGAYMPGFDVGAMRALEEAEIGRGGYVALAYHELYMGDGDVVEARPVSKMGGATINNNSTSVAICLPGDYSVPNAVVSFGQAGSAIDRLTAMVVYGVLTRDFELHPHRDVFATACPGVFADNLAGIRAAVEARLAGGNVPPIIPPVETHPAGDAGSFLSHLAEAVTETRRFLAMGAVIAAGAHNDAVFTVQIAVNVDGAAAPPLVVDSAFGPATYAAVRQYQANHGLVVDGIVGRATYGVMYP